MMDFVSSVIQNIIANFVTALIVALFAYMLLYLRLSGFGQRLRKYIHPKKRVVVFPDFSIEHVVKLENSGFESPINERERDILVNFYTSRNGVRSATNGVAVRLDGLKKNGVNHYVPEISKVGFHDFIATNLTVFPANAPVRSVRGQFLAINKWVSSFSILNTVSAEVKKHGKPESVADVLANRSLANIIAVSILIEDINGRVCLVKKE